MAERKATAAPILLLASTILTAAIGITYKYRKRTNNTDFEKGSESCHYEDLIGNTPMLALSKLSSCLPANKRIFAKMECHNPGGTGKDRAALFMLKDAEQRGLLPPPLQSEEKIFSIDDSRDRQEYETSNCKRNSQQKELVLSTIQTAISQTKTGGIVVEGTSGSTGISLATLCAQRGHSTIIVMPDDQALEKQTILRCLGAIVHIVPNAAISNPNHYVNVARRITNEINDSFKKHENETEDGRMRNTSHDNRITMRNRRIKIKAAFMNQFENESNYFAHYTTTGPEIWHQTKQKINLFCMSSGTGGTLSGVGRYLKEQSACKIVLVDPPGSALYNKVKYNVAYASEQRERNLLRHRYDTLAEGIGLDRVTHNFALGLEEGVVDNAMRVSDQEAVDMAHWLLKEEGIFVGSSSAMNVAAAVRLALDGESELNDNPDSCIVTVICDGGQRHLTRFWNRDFVIGWGLEWPGDNEAAWKDRLPSCLS